MRALRQIVLIAKGVWLEALRRRELYVIVAVSCLFILALARLRFFGLDGLSKFYREIALKIMGFSTALTVIVLGARQLPREFESRTVYPLLARPVGRFHFLLGKQLGVMGAGFFCMTLFMLLYVAGCLVLGVPLYPLLLLQHVFLQTCLFTILTSLSFLLSIRMSHDAALSLGFLFYLVSNILSNLFLLLYDTAEGLGRTLIVALTWLFPQLVLFDLSEKNVHGDVWPPLSASVLGQLALYALVFTGAYFLLALWSFRRKPL